MARRNFWFPGKSDAERQALLEEALVDVNEQRLAGKVNVEFAAADTSFRAQVDRTLPLERILQMILADLSVLDPTNYPPEDVTPVRITTARFNDLS